MKQLVWNRVTIQTMGPQTANRAWNAWNVRIHHYEQQAIRYLIKNIFWAKNLNETCHSRRC